MHGSLSVSAILLFLLIADTLAQTERSHPAESLRVYQVVPRDFDDENGALSYMPACSCKVDITEIQDSLVVSRLIKGLSDLDSVKSIDSSATLLNLLATIYPDSELTKSLDEGNFLSWRFKRADFDREMPPDYVLHLNWSGSAASYTEFVIVRSPRKITCQKLWGDYCGIMNLFYRAKPEFARQFCRAVGIASPPWNFEDVPDLDRDGCNELLEFDTYWPGYLEPLSNRSYTGFPMPYYWDGTSFVCNYDKRDQYFQLLLDNSFLLDLFDALAIDLRIGREQQ